MNTLTSDEFGERIKTLIFKTNKNQSSFASSIGVSHTAIGKIVKGGTKPGYAIIDAILKAYPQVNRDWLLEGKGEMFIETISPDSSPDNYLQEHLRNLEKQFAEMREMFSSQMATKDKQIEKLMDLLGKLDVGENTTCKILDFWPPVGALIA